MKRRSVRLLATLVVTGLCTAYILWKVDIRQTLHVLVHANLGYFIGAVAIMILSVWPMAWRWQQLLSARGGRLRAGDREVPGRPVPLGRRRVRDRDDRARGRALLPQRAPAPGQDRSVPALHPRRAPDPRRLRGHSQLPRPPGPAGMGVHAHARGAVGARARDLARRPRRGRRPLASAVLRDGPAAVPRAARAVLGERDCGARVVLRQLPRQARRRPGQGLRDRVPLLRRDALPFTAGGAAARLAEHSRARAPEPEPWLKRASSSSRTTRCPGSSSASRACAATRRSSSTTARRMAPSSSCASASRRRACSSRRTRASAAARTPACGLPPATTTCS